MSPPKSPSRIGFSDKDVQALLVRHRCPTPFHVLRTLFLGNISSPRLDVSALAPVTRAWGGELPVFASKEEAEAVLGALLQGFWNRLAEHQSTRHPFRLLRVDVPATRQALQDLAERRAQELRGFVDGLFGNEEEMPMPQKAHHSLSALSELLAMFDSTARLLADQAAQATAKDLKELLRNLQRMTILADEHINKVVQVCKQARGQRLGAMKMVTSSKAEAMGNHGGEPYPHSREEDAEPDFIESPLSRTVTNNGVEVAVEIYGDSTGRWILEIVDAANASHVWDEPFETDQQALDEALRALDEDPLDFFGTSANQPLN